MNRRTLLGRMGTLLLGMGPLGRLLAARLPRLGDASEAPLTTLAFGSCARQWDPQPVWESVARAAPQLFAFIGDNVYADTDDMGMMRKVYAALGSHPQFARFRRRHRLVATWDDHDYGRNDAGAEYPFKEESKRIMLDFFGEPERSARRRRAGIYTSYFLGESPRRTQILLLDLRSFRGALGGMESECEGETWRGYSPSGNPCEALLGSSQWVWLEHQLRQPADFRILASSIQLVSPEHPWEKWSNFPHEKARLLRLIDRLGVRNLMVLSGDMHYGELAMERTPAGFELHDFTSSGLNIREKAQGVTNPHRLLYADDLEQFGLVRLGWRADSVRATVDLRDAQGRSVFARTLTYPRATG